ncbi:unnamed protein product [Rotaria sp. Silwood1]|nr:unnamed protein product [Rotaria sp. Silwood1]CAF1688237.1 unnamed protein product [Rotaria sp. Silwood1]CAF3741147.1 unnamed protein product [Rotaria sp. Silwood1]CAF3741165.1 unnamed protein product [Rotaria sp. Silwood1]CAF4721317.1 unnamed protein product [Rotaria sp. Silwood1]
MTDNADGLTTTMKTFCFSSGELITLEDDQIEKIPYLIALVSSAHNFQSVCDKNGHFKLDPLIQFKQFSFAIQSLSFHSVRQLFTHLPKANDIISIIALLDFLGIGPQSDPSLKHVDSTFFSKVVYSPFLNEDLQIIRLWDIQNMAVRFAIAMAKGEYDFNNRKVIDQIYWFLMFILSAYEYFGPRLRHHVYGIAKHWFSLFKSSRLKCLRKLVCTTEKNRRVRYWINDGDADPDAETEDTMEQLFASNKVEWFYMSRHPSLQRRRDLLNRANSDYYSDYYSECYCYPHLFGCWRPKREEDILDRARKRLIEIMYMRLASQIYQQIREAIRKRQLNFEQLKNVESILEDFFKCKLVQQEMRECILE